MAVCRVFGNAPASSPTSAAGAVETKGTTTGGKDAGAAAGKKEIRLHRISYHTSNTVCATRSASAVASSGRVWYSDWSWPVSYTHLRAHETVLDLVCRLLLE